MELLVTMKRELRKLKAHRLNIQGMVDDTKELKHGFEKSKRIEHEGWGSR